MEKEILKFISENELNPFNKSKTSVRSGGKSIFATKDAKSVSTKALGTISKRFNFADTSNIFEFFRFPSVEKEILERQEFFRSIQPFAYENSFLSDLKIPKPFWNPNYDIVVVTEDDSTFKELKELGCAVKFLINESDVMDLERYDVVQVLDCDSFSRVLERLPQSVFLKSTDEAYLERYVRILSGWKENLEVLSSKELPDDIKKTIDELNSLCYLLNDSQKEELTKEIAEDYLTQIREEVSQKVKELSISGNSLIEVLSKGILPPELDGIVKSSINKTGLPENIFVRGIPVNIDEKELEIELRNQSLSKFSSAAEEIKGKSAQLCQIPDKLRALEKELLIFDFKSSMAEWMKAKTFPQISEELVLENSMNEFLENPHPVSFYLNEKERCSILTGANSGGKTTLLENIIQILTFCYIGLPLRGNVKVPLLNEIYYFAKNKGSANKGAFETLLTQLSQIDSKGKTMILADEIEAVTEPGVAGKMIAASAQFFINQGCYLVFATHLGQEIEKIMPTMSRIDGIEAKGLDENNDLIVDHNPVIGRLASSTPELIVEKMAKSLQKDYFKFLHNYLKGVQAKVPDIEAEAKII